MFAPRSALKEWTGNSTAEPNDYDRACAVSDEIGLISIGSAHALVLGDEPDRTALLNHSPEGVVIVRWRWADSEHVLLSELDAGITQLRSTVKGVFQALDDDYLLFDAAYSGSENTDALAIRLRSGRYTFDVAEFRPNDRTCAVVHRILRQLPGPVVASS